MKFSLRWFKHGAPEATATGGRQAREYAERELARVRAETSYYAGLGRDLRTIRERNHFADNIRATMREC